MRIHAIMSAKTAYDARGGIFHLSMSERNGLAQSDDSLCSIIRE
ncbi:MULTISPECIES: hypothetical protein [unclassified Pseudomonas]